MPDPALDTMLKTALHDYVDELTPMRAPSFADVRRHARRRQLVRRGGGVASAAVVVGLGATLVVGTSGHDPVVEPGGVEAIQGPAGQAIPAPANVSCVATSTLHALLQGTHLAVDGTVDKVDDPGTGGAVLVTLRVHEWFRGGHRSEITVRMQPPRPYPQSSTRYYGVGTRLLVFTDGGGSGRTSTLRAGGCGDIRYYSAETAAQWRDLLRG